MWRADGRPGVWSLVEIITIKQITISFLSPTMSELKTFGPCPKIPSPQAQPALDQADTTIEGKEGTGPVSKSRFFSWSSRCALARGLISSPLPSTSLLVSFLSLPQDGTDTPV